MTTDPQRLHQQSLRGHGGQRLADPYNAHDKNGGQVYGTATFYDALGRVIAVQDPLFGQSGYPGIACPSLGSNATSCTVYELDGVQGDNNTYETAKSIDANNHVTEHMSDVLGNTIYVRYDSGTNGGTLTPNELIASQYNALNEPTAVTTSDLQPFPNETQERDGHHAV